MPNIKTVVCLANSRKTSGRCIAGKVWNNGVCGEWFRPVSARSSHEVSEEERRYKNGQDPKLLDIISIPFSLAQPLPHQRENYVLDPGYYWTPQGALSWHQIDALLDHPATLWSLGSQSSGYKNNRVTDQYQDGVSLYLIVVERLKVIVGPKSPKYPKRIVRGEFSYGGSNYLMSITDPVVEKGFLVQADGDYVIENPRLCISLGDPFGGYLYKLIAAVLYPERFQ